VAAVGVRTSDIRVDELASTGPDYAEMMARYLGPAVIAAITDDDVTEVYVNPQDSRVRVDTHSAGKRETGYRIAPERLEMFLNAAASAQGVEIGPSNPQIQTELPATVFGGARLQGFLPPLAAGAAFTIRKRPTRVYPLVSYVERGMLPDLWRRALEEAVVTRQTIVVCGATGSGKSTFANALLLVIAERCPGERIVILEDTVELQCPVADHLALRTTPELPLSALVKATLRASPTRIVIGEVRDASALDFLDAAATGHPGGVCTVHASSALGALERLDRLAQRANVPSQRALVAEAVDLVVVLSGGNAPESASATDAPERHARRVTDVVRITGLAPDGRFILHRYTESDSWQPV
jgi:type IV secretion system protein TrbB